jgi:hypothetical protein
VVRRPAAVLRLNRRRRTAARLAFAAPFAALAYFLAAPALPALAAGDVTILVAGSIGLLLVAASTLALLPAHEMLVAPLLIACGSALLVAALNADSGGVGAGANVVEALLAGAAALLFARWLAVAVIAVAVPLFVAAVDVLSFAVGPTSRMLDDGTARVDALSFDLPAWGGAGSAGHLGFSDAFFLSLFAAWAWHFGLRRGATIAGMLIGLLGALAAGVILDRAIPALPFIAAGYLLPNADRLWKLARRDGAVVDGT